jgi:hypothetical protein
MLANFQRIVKGKKRRFTRERDRFLERLRFFQNGAGAGVGFVLRTVKNLAKIIGAHL